MEITVAITLIAWKGGGDHYERLPWLALLNEHLAVLECWRAVRVTMTVRVRVTVSPS